MWQLSTPASTPSAHRFPAHAPPFPRHALPNSQRGVPQTLTPKFSSSAQVIQPRSKSYQTTQRYLPHPPHAHSQSTRSAVGPGHSYVGLYQPKVPPTGDGGSGKRRLTLPPAKTSYMSDKQVTTWEPTPLCRSHAAAAVPQKPTPSAYVPRHLRALQEASQAQLPPERVPTASSSEDDWDRDWRQLTNRTA